jgi:hypothetical protein
VKLDQIDPVVLIPLLAPLALLAGVVVWRIRQRLRDRHHHAR